LHARQGQQSKYSLEKEETRLKITESSTTEQPIQPKKKKKRSTGASQHMLQGTRLPANQPNASQPDVTPARPP
jgi:hypothetical protein